MTFCLLPKRFHRIKVPMTTALCLLTSIAASQAQNLLSNAGFESTMADQKIPGWTAYGASAFVMSGPSMAHDGNHSLKVYQSFSGSENYNGVYQDYISGPGAVYAAEGYADISSGDVLTGQNAAWLEVSFRDANANVLALYRSSLVTTNTSSTPSLDTWMRLPVTYQINPASYQVMGTATNLVAPPGTYFVRYQVVFQGDAHNSRGSVFFDDLKLTQTGGQPYGDWKLAWSDEFNGQNIDTNVWTYDLGGSGWGNNELEYYTSDVTNSYVSNGCLHIAARQESRDHHHYTSARIKSQGLFSFNGGRIEWRAQLPKGLGFWPALWLLGTNISTVGWPGCGEIDVVENKGSDLGMVQGSLHSGSDETAIYHFLDGGSVADFHTYTLDWTTNSILFYIDGHLYETQKNWSSSQGKYPVPFNQPFFIIMNIAVGGNYLQNPSEEAINQNSSFPGEMLVDYVRIYDQNQPVAKNEN